MTSPRSPRGWGAGGTPLACPSKSSWPHLFLQPLMPGRLCRLPPAAHIPLRASTGTHCSLPRAPLRLQCGAPTRSQSTRVHATKRLGAALGVSALEWPLTTREQELMENASHFHPGQAFLRCHFTGPSEGPAAASSCGQLHSHLVPPAFSGLTPQNFTHTSWHHFPEKLANTHLPEVLLSGKTG